MSVLAQAAAAAMIYVYLDLARAAVSKFIQHILDWMLIHVSPLVAGVCRTPWWLECGSFDVDPACRNCAPDVTDELVPATEIASTYSFKDICTACILKVTLTYMIYAFRCVGLPCENAEIEGKGQHAGFENAT